MKPATWPASPPAPVPAPAPLSRSAWLGIGAMLLLGLAMRVGWMLTHLDERGLAGEARRIAITLATTGVFGDPFYPGQGPTAHLTPTSPAIAGAVFWLFGVATPAANFILASWCLLQVLGSFFLLTLLFRRLGTPYLGLLLALAALCLLPVYIGNETVIFRYWDAALAVNLATASLLLLMKLEGQGDPGWRTIVLAAFLAALTMFVTPTLGLPIYAAAALYIWRNLSLPRALAAGVVATLALAAIVTPWAIRNYHSMGAWVLLRDNAGMQLAVANYPAGVHPADPYAAYERRLDEISPYFNPKLKTEMEAAGGEVAYNRKLSLETKQWIRDHPADFIHLTLRHFTEFYWPREWQFRHTGSGSFATERALILALASTLALIGLARGVWARRPGFLYLIPVVLLPGLTYSVFQPLPRYIYLVYGVLIFLAADCVARWLIVDGRLRWRGAARR